MRNALFYLGAVIVSTIIGFLVFDYFFDASFSQISNNNVQVVSRNLSGQFYTHITFALSIGSIPIFYLIMTKMTNLFTIKHRLSAFGIIIVSGILLWQLRVYQLNSQSQKLSRLNISNEIKMQFDYEQLYFGIFLFVGFLLGTVLSILIFRNRNKTLEE